MGTDKVHQSRCPHLKQFYSLTENFLYNYDHHFYLPGSPVSDHVTAKTPQDIIAYKIYNHEVFQLNFNFLHATRKDVQHNNFRVHEIKLIHNLIYYTFCRDNLPQGNFIYINDQLNSSHFLNYSYTIKQKYLKGKLWNYDPVKNYYVFQPTERTERPLNV